MIKNRNSKIIMVDYEIDFFEGLVEAKNSFTLLNRNGFLNFKNFTPTQPKNGIKRLNSEKMAFFYCFLIEIN